MNRIGSKLIFAGIVMFIGPFFGFTIRGQQGTEYGFGVFLGMLAIVIGFVLLSVGKRE